MYYSFPVSFADNIARSLSIVFNVLFTFLILGKQTSLNTIATLAIVMVGFYMGIDGELNFSLVGTAAGVLASVFVSLNSVYTSRVLPRVGNDKSLLLFYNNFNSCLLFLPLIYQFELPVLWQHSDKFFSVIFWMAIIATGIMGFAIGLVTVLQVKVTSPLTHNFSATPKAGAKGVVAYNIGQNTATAKGILGIFLVLVGSGAYGWVQMNESIKPAPTPISAAINAGTVELPKV
jgi:GDP-fucose transporter C1